MSQDGIVGLLAGPQQSSAEGKKIHRELADKIRSVLDGQRLVSLDTLIALGDALKEKADGVNRRRNICSTWRANSTNSRCLSRSLQP